MINSPFKIAIDTAEQHPWKFLGIKSDAKDDDQIIWTQTVQESLGRYPNSFGDYSIEGYAGRVGIERKSRDDCIATVLGFNDGRRMRFESELENLSSISSLVIVECSHEECLDHAGDYGGKKAEHQQKIFNRSIISYLQDYNVRWFWATNRGHAESACYRFLSRYWHKKRK